MVAIDFYLLRQWEPLSNSQWKIRFNEQARGAWFGSAYVAVVSVVRAGPHSHWNAWMEGACAATAKILRGT